MHVEVQLLNFLSWAAEYFNIMPIAKGVRLLAMDMG